VVAWAVTEHTVMITAAMKNSTFLPVRFM
jgi:hypothetical protein